MNRISTLSLLTLAVTILMSQAATAAILFEDSFESPPETVGSAPTLWSTTTNVSVNSSKASDGSNSLFLRDGNRSATMSTAAPLAGSDSIVVSFDLAQGTNAIESNESIVVSIDFGSGFSTLLTDAGRVDGYTGTYSGSPISLATTAGNATSFVSYSITVAPAAIPLAATEASLRFSTSTGSNNEDYYIDNVVIAPVPEPATLLTSCIGLVCVVGRRCRRD